jgi:SAM-dependent methyltransferase
MTPRRPLLRLAALAWRGLQFAPLALAVRLSPRLHARVAAHYWGRTKRTHADMAAAQFEFYADRLLALMAPAADDLLLDYGCGNGEIGKLLMQRKHRVEFAEFAPHFVEALRAEGLTAYPLAEVPAARFDVVLANNSFFYNHPRVLNDRIRHTLQLLKPGGRLFLTDNPSLQLAHRASRNPALIGVYRLTGTYQPRLGGFFIDETRLQREFGTVTILDSWSPYRRHYVIRRPA